VRPQRSSRRRFAAFLAALALVASAFGGLVIPRLADGSTPASLKAKPSLIQEKLDDDRCRRDRHSEETDLALETRA
jgi:hypothetical protein